MSVKTESAKAKTKLVEVPTLADELSANCDRLGIQFCLSLCHEGRDVWVSAFKNGKGKAIAIPFAKVHSALSKLVDSEFRERGHER